MPVEDVCVCVCVCARVCVCVPACRGWRIADGGSHWVGINVGCGGGGEVVGCLYVQQRHFYGLHARIGVHLTVTLHATRITHVFPCSFHNEH